MCYRVYSNEVYKATYKKSKQFSIKNSHRALGLTFCKFSWETSTAACGQCFLSPFGAYINFLSLHNTKNFMLTLYTEQRPFHKPWSLLSTMKRYLTFLPAFSLLKQFERCSCERQTVCNVKVEYRKNSGFLLVTGKINLDRKSITNSRHHKKRYKIKGTSQTQTQSIVMGQFGFLTITAEILARSLAYFHCQ